MKSICFINEKGGVGKSSATFNTAWELMMRGKKCLIIDLDGQSSNITFFCGIKKEDDMLTAYDVLKGKTTIEKAIKNVDENLDILPANIDVTGISHRDKISVLKKAIHEIQDKYDYILFDVNPEPNWSHMIALSCSEYAIIPMLPDIASLEANKGVVETIFEVQETTNSKLKVLGILFNRYNDQTNLSKEVLMIASKMAKSLNSKVFNSKIRQAVVLSECIGSHIGITEYEPKSGAAKDYMSLVEEIEQGVN